MLHKNNFLCRLMSEADVTSDTSFSFFTEGNVLNCTANLANVAIMFPAVGSCRLKRGLRGIPELTCLEIVLSTVIFVVMVSYY